MPAKEPRFPLSPSPTIAIGVALLSIALAVAGWRRPAPPTSYASVGAVATAAIPTPR